MKFYGWFLSVMILMGVFIPNTRTHALTMYRPIHELVDESDIVFVGTVTRSLMVSNKVNVRDKSKNRKKRGIISRAPKVQRIDKEGSLYCIQVGKLLYAKERIRRELFSKSRIEEINVALTRNRKSKPVKLFAFRGGRWHTESASYLENESQLFFLKVLKGFPGVLAETTVIREFRAPRENGSKPQQLTKSDLTEKFYFEACIEDLQATWILTWENQKKKLPTVEAFCEVMSIPDLVEREQRLRGLLNHKDKLLAGNAAVALGRVQQALKMQKIQQGLGMMEKPAVQEQKK